MIISGFIAGFRLSRPSAPPRPGGAGPDATRPRLPDAKLTIPEHRPDDGTGEWPAGAFRAARRGRAGAARADSR
ncbi:hypothetical protein, partial [Burkholderia pseudomallei]|uniref:hypothetical protein n=1 Tax=Burkholderia pseudomallei TaxID=28450 RepID=UPI001C4D86DB